MEIGDRKGLCSPLLSYKADIEFAPLQVFTGVTHDLVEGIFQKMVPAYDQSYGQGETT